jgi:hypothetical protein
LLMNGHGYFGRAANVPVEVVAPQHRPLPLERMLRPRPHCNVDPVTARCESRPLSRLVGLLGTKYI